MIGIERGKVDLSARDAGWIACCLFGSYSLDLLATTCLFLFSVPPSCCSSSRLSCPPSGVFPSRIVQQAHLWTTCAAPGRFLLVWSWFCFGEYPEECFFSPWSGLHARLTQLSATVAPQRKSPGGDSRKGACEAKNSCSPVCAVQTSVARRCELENAQQLACPSLSQHVSLHCSNKSLLGQTLCSSPRSVAGLGTAAESLEFPSHPLLSSLCSYPTQIDLCTRRTSRFLETAILAKDLGVAYSGMKTHGAVVPSTTGPGLHTKQ